MGSKKSTFKKDLEIFIRGNEPLTVNEMCVEFKHKTKEQITAAIGNLRSKNNIEFIYSKNEKGVKQYSIIGNVEKVDPVDTKVKTDFRNDRAAMTLSQIAIDLENKSETAINGLELFKEKLDLMVLEVHGLLEKIRD